MFGKLNVYSGNLKTGLHLPNAESYNGQSQTMCVRLETAYLDALQHLTATWESSEPVFHSGVETNKIQLEGAHLGEHLKRILLRDPLSRKVPNLKH